MTNLKFTPVQLGNSELRVPPICLGTMTFGEQVSEKDAHAIMDLSLERGINLIRLRFTLYPPQRPPLDRQRLLLVIGLRRTEDDARRSL